MPAWFFLIKNSKILKCYSIEKLSDKCFYILRYCQSVTIKSYYMCCRTWYISPYITCVNVRDIFCRTWYFLQYTIAQFLQYRIPKSKYLCRRKRHIIIYLNTKKYCKLHCGWVRSLRIIEVRIDENQIAPNNWMMLIIVMILTIVILLWYWQ